MPSYITAITIILYLLWYSNDSNGFDSFQIQWPSSSSFVRGSISFIMLQMLVQYFDCFIFSSNFLGSYSSFDIGCTIIESCAFPAINSILWIAVTPRAPLYFATDVDAKRSLNFAFFSPLWNALSEFDPSLCRNKKHTIQYKFKHS